jgi:hypothetical protein
MTDEQHHEPVGNVGEEAVKLLQALTGWAKESGGEYAEAGASAAAGAARRMQTINEHVGTGGEDCRYCPLCQVIAAVRGTSPEVKEHLSAAATSLLHAAGELMATSVPDQDARPRDTTVEKIDLSDGDEWEDD